VLNHPAVQQYLSLESEMGGCRRAAFKIRHRDPWYQTPLPTRPDGFISGMSEAGVWMCLNEMPALNATNTLYVCHFRDHLRPNERFACALGLLTTAFCKRLRRARRRYADGLEKIEPGQLSDLELRSFKHVKKAKATYRKALRSLLAGDLVQARGIADRAFDEGT
jgi:hypothetical protein